MPTCTRSMTASRGIARGAGNRTPWISSASGRGGCARGLRPADPTAYAIFGRSLHAPCDGRVIAAHGTAPDLEVPQQDMVNRLGNHVILDCDGVWIVLAHLRQGSVAVAPGDAVRTGARLGAIGNSGASSEPHLHIHAQRPAAEGAPPISSRVGISSAATASRGATRPDGLAPDRRKA